MWMSVNWAMTSVIRPATTPLAATCAAVTLDTPLMSMAADVMVCGHNYCHAQSHFNSYKYDLDDNECATNTTNACRQICVNTPGSYVCQCNAGFRLSLNGHDCKGMTS